MQKGIFIQNGILTVDTARQSNRSAIFTGNIQSIFHARFLLPLSCIVPHYIVALGTRFLVLQRCYCPSDLAAITIISAHDLSRYPLKPKRLCEVSCLSLPGEILRNSTRPTDTMRWTSRSWDLAGRGTKFHIVRATVRAFGTYLPHGWLFDDSP